MSEWEVVSYLTSHLSELIPGLNVSSREIPIPGGKRVDILARDKDGKDVFIEFKKEFTRHDVGQTIDLYSAISNSESRNARLLLLGMRADPAVRRVLKGMGVNFVPLAKLPIPREVLRRWATDFEVQRKRKLTPQESKAVSFLEKHHNVVVTTRDLAAILGSSPNYSSQIALRLQKRGWLERVERGKYVFIPLEYGYERRYPPMDPLLVGSVLVSPYYFSFATANAFYGFTTQIRSTIYVATPIRRPPVTWRSNTFRFGSMSQSRFFGFRREAVESQEVFMATPEKAVVDSVYRPDLAGGLPEVVQVLMTSRRKVRREKLLGSTLGMQSSALTQRMGFLTDLLKDEGAEIIDAGARTKLRNAIGKSQVYLGSPAKFGKGGEFDKTWRVYRNVPNEELLSEIK